MAPVPGGQYPHGPLGGLALTLILATVRSCLAFPHELSGWRSMRISSCPAAGTGPAAIIHTVRGLPLIMFIFWVYFVSPLVIGRSIGG